MSYIKLEDLQKIPIRINHYDEENGNINFVLGIETAIEYAESLPKADVVEVRHGEWIIEKRHSVSENPYMDDTYYAGASCSECGFCIHEAMGSWGYPKLKTTNFCPECGAKMGGEGKE